MPHIRVVTDSACDIPESLLRQFNITVVPLSIGWGSETVPDRGEAASATVLRRYAEGQVPRIVSPDVEEFSRVYRQLRETCDGIISLHLSGRLSDTLNSAAIAREAFGPVGHGGPFPITVVDSFSLSMGLGWMALAIARAAASGLELPKLANMAVRLRGQSHVAFISGGIQGLLKVEGATHIHQQASSIAAMKPLFHLDEGQISVYEKTRTRAKARDALYNFVEDFPKIGEMAVFHTGSENDLEHLMTRVGAIYPRDRVIVLQPGAAVTALLGPDALGVAVFEGEE